jgi:hypothetical protein
MSAVAETPNAHEHRDAVVARRLSAYWHLGALGCVLALAAFLDFFRLGQNGYANTYYAGAVRSMLDSWRNFLFVSFDPGGLVSVDKPPLALWVEAASAKVFGYSGLAILVPEALAGVVAVCSRRSPSPSRRSRSRSTGTTTPTRSSCSSSSSPRTSARGQSSRAGCGRCSSPRSSSGSHSTRRCSPR